MFNNLLLAGFLLIISFVFVKTQKRLGTTRFIVPVVGFAFLILGLVPAALVVLLAMFINMAYSGFFFLANQLPSDKAWAEATGTHRVVRPTLGTPYSDAEVKAMAVLAVQELAAQRTPEENAYEEQQSRADIAATQAMYAVVVVPDETDSLNN